MAKDDDTRLMQDLQGLFREKEGLKIFLEQMLRIVMESEVEQHIGATPYERRRSAPATARAPSRGR